MAARRSRDSWVGKWRTGGFKLGKITFVLSAVLESQRSGLSRSGLSKGNAYPGQIAKKVGC